MQLGTLATIWRYPTKSLRPESLAQTQVLGDGIPGDRAAALIVRSGHTRVGKTYRGKEHNLLHTLDDPAASVAAARQRGVEIEITDVQEHYFDDAPISLIVDRWMDGLSKHVGYAVEPQRFRPNFFVRAIDGFALDEAALTGRELALGEVALRVRYPIERCVTPTYDLESGVNDPEILRYVAQARSNWMGIYCDVLRAGVVRIGDSLDLIER